MSGNTGHVGPRIHAISNQKGGVGKTTTSINLGSALTQKGYKVLIVDLDPQGNASTGVGIPHELRRSTAYDLIMANAQLSDVVIQSRTDGLLVVPSTSDLSSADLELAAKANRSSVLKDTLRRPNDLELDYILIDCPPSLNILTINALVAADSVIVPLQCEFFALEGLSQLITTIRDVRHSANPGLRLEGVVLTMHDRRNNLSQQVEADARQNLGDLVFKTVIPRNVRLSEAPSHAMSVLEYDPTSAGSKAYIALATELVARQS